MTARFVCPFCNQEVEGEVYRGLNHPGDYVECECGAEVEIIEARRNVYIIDEFWEDNVKDALSETEDRSSLEAVRR